MIFVTVGTTKFPFNRLLRATDRAMVKWGRGEKIIVQKGASNYKFKYKYRKIFKEISFDKMIDFLKKSRVVVCHGGPITIFLALKYGQNKPLVVLRSRKFGEHVDDHQLFYAKFLRKRKLIKAVFPDENLVDRVVKYIKSPEKLFSKKRNSDSKRLIKKLTEYTESIK